MAGMAELCANGLLVDVWKKLTLCLFYCCVEEWKKLAAQMIYVVLWFHVQYTDPFPPSSKHSKILYAKGGGEWDPLEDAGCLRFSPYNQCLAKRPVEGEEGGASLQLLSIGNCSRGYIHYMKFLVVYLLMKWL
uniref:Uncharacterized protein n=1 Tax=Micrurus spixii TaxID=129469 RepID=A0A2D4LKR9_9SAUR